MRDDDLAPLVDDYFRSGAAREDREAIDMAEFIRVSHAALSAIPDELRFLMHSMYEDSDIDGANQAEATFNFIESQAPGTFVAILANDSVTPPCCNQKLHYSCDFYEPYWYTILIAAPVWRDYEKAVMAKHAAWQSAHGCHQRSATDLVAKTNALLDSIYKKEE